MDIILLEKIHNLGKIGDKVSVKPGYGRNFLIPEGKAVPATEKYLIEFEKRRAELERLAAEKLAHSQARHKTLHHLSVMITVKSGEEGKLFGSIGTTDIVDAVVALGHTLERSEVRMPDGPIRQVGDYALSLDLGSEVIAVLNVTVAPENKIEE